MQNGHRYWIFFEMWMFLVVTVWLYLPDAETLQPHCYAHALQKECAGINVRDSLKKIGKQKLKILGSTQVGSLLFSLFTDYFVKKNLDFLILIFSIMKKSKIAMTTP